MASPTEVSSPDPGRVGSGGLTPGLPERARTRGTPAPWSLRVVALLVAMVFAMPLLWLLLRNVQLGNAASAVLGGQNLRPLANSVLLAASVATATALIGTAAAWFTVRTDLPGARLWNAILPLPLVIPSFIGAFTLLAAFAPGGLLERVLGIASLPRLEGFWGAFVVLTLLTYPYVFLPVSARLRQLPASLEESARLLGRTGWSSFYSVVLPQARSAVLAGALLVFLYTVSDFGAVQLLRYDTLTRVIYATRLDQATSLALSLQLGLLAVAVVAVERILVHTQQPAGPRVARPLRVPLGRLRWVAAAGVGTVASLSLAAPLLVLGYWAGRGLLEDSARAAAVAADPLSLLAPLVNTTLAGVAAAVVAVAVVLPVAYLTVRHRGLIAAWSNALVVGGFALPGLVVALALASFTLRGPLFVAPLYQTLVLLILAYTVHFGAQTLRAAQVAVAAVPPRVGDAARTLGATGWRRLVRIDIPLMLPGLGAGAGLVLLSAMKELPATLLLAPPGFTTLATRIWNAQEDAFWADASLAALVLIALSGLLTWVLVIRRFDALD